MYVSLKYPTAKPTAVMKMRRCNLLSVAFPSDHRLRWEVNPFWCDARHPLMIWVTIQDYTQWESNWSWINNNCAGIQSFSISEEAFFSMQIIHKPCTHVVWLNIWHLLTGLVNVYRCGATFFKPSITKFHQWSSCTDVWLFLKCALLCRRKRKTASTKLWDA